MNIFGQNLRLSFRLMRKNLGFTLVTVITLALGIGANTAIFSAVYPALLRKLPYRQPENLVTLGESRSATCCPFAASYPDFLDWRKFSKSFDSLVGFYQDGFTMIASGEPKNVSAVMVTPNFFTTLGVAPILGRDFAEGEDLRDPTGPTVAILSYGFWQSDFGGDPGVIGRGIRLGNNAVNIIGVLPRDFEFSPSGSPLIWVPLHMNEYYATARNSRWLQPVGRLAPGVSFDRGLAEMRTITSQLAKEYPKQNAAIHVEMGRLRERIVGNIRPLFAVLFGAVGLVLLIACANVASLLMTRSIGRRREFALRVALGARRRDLLSQLLMESLLLSSVGAVAGLIAGRLGVSLLLRAIPDGLLQAMPYLRDAGINLQVLAFLCGVTFIAAMFFGIVPALGILRTPVNEVLKDETRGGTSGTHARLRGIFVVAEIAICMVLLAASGLMIRSLRTLLRQDPGFDPLNVLAFTVSLPYPYDQTWPNDNQADRMFDRRFSERLRELPGVISVSATSNLPAVGSAFINRFAIEGHPTEPGHDFESLHRILMLEYFETMKIPLVEGRFFAPTDTKQIQKVWIVNRAFAKTFFPGEDPIGKRFRLTYSPNEPLCQIVGIVADVAEDSLAAPPPPVFYSLNDQEFIPIGNINYVVRTQGNPERFIGMASSALRQVDPQLALIDARALEQIVGESPAVFLRRYPSYLIGSFAALALVLAIVGLYGLISYSVVNRTREIGIRAALGAQRGQILQLVLRQGLAASLIGVAIGAAAGLGLTQWMASLLYGVNPRDPITFISVATLLILVAVAACLLPARRATRVDPIIALRSD
jgi:predicted permease